MEGWPSGRRRTLGKRVGRQLSRVFESRSLRHATVQPHPTMCENSVKTATVDISESNTVHCSLLKSALLCGTECGTKLTPIWFHDPTQRLTDRRSGRSLRHLLQQNLHHFSSKRYR